MSRPYPSAYAPYPPLPPPLPPSRKSGEGTSRRPIQHDLAGLAGAHGLEALLKVARGQPMRDHLADVEAALQHRDHLVPGLEHLAAINALDRQQLEDDLGPVARRRPGGEAEQRQ